MKDPILLGEFTAHGNAYVMRGDPKTPGFRIYRDQGHGMGYLLASVDDPGNPELRLDGGRALTTGAAQECLALAMDQWNGLVSRGSS